MKRIFVSTLILLFAATAISFAKLSDHPQYAEETSDTHGGFFSGDANNSSSETPKSSEQYGGFFQSPDGPGGRPDSGDGIGQNAPLHGGLHILVACGIIFVAVKFFNENRKKNDN